MFELIRAIIVFGTLLYLRHLILSFIGKKAMNNDEEIDKNDFKNYGIWAGQTH